MAAASQVIWGVFATFQSGADVAWLTDEIGEEAARPLYLRGDQFWHAAALVWINQGLDPKTRATINSVGGQADAVGQAAGGPALGAVPVAIVVSPRYNFPRSCCTVAPSAGERWERSPRTRGGGRVGRRTPLMRAMRELADVHTSLSTDRAVSMDEALELHLRLLSRRQLLKRAGVLGAVAAVAGPPLSALARPFRGGAHDARVVVVGAGLAGVSCAYKLQQHGIRADLYEARDRVGGRCWTARTFDGGQVAEHGGEFVDTRHVQLRRLVAALGLHLDDLWPAYEEMEEAHGLLVLDGALRDRHEVREHFDVVIRRLVRDARKVGPYRWGQAGPAAIAFDRMTMREWMDANVPGGSSSLLGTSIDIGLTGFWGIDPEDTSAITLLDTYVTPYPGGPADERYHIRGGSDQVPTMLADLLPAGALHLESPLEAFEERSDGTYELVFGNVASPVVADHVVLCLPFTTLRDVDLDRAGLDARRVKAIRELGMGTNAKVFLQFEDRFPTFGWNGSFQLDAPKSGSWDSALAQPGPGGLLTVYTGGKTGAGYPTDDPHAPAPAGVVDDVLTFLDTYLPGMRDSFNGRSWLDSWVDDPWVKGSYAVFLPGQWTTFFGYMGRPQGNVHFAGEHTSTYSQGYLNGGVETGLRAAREVIHATGRRARPLI